MERLKVFVFGVVVVALVLTLGVVGREYALRMDSHYAPREEQVRHNTFECSQSHTDGLVHELRDYRDQYAHADASGRSVLRDRFMQDFDAYTCGDLPADVRDFAATLN